MPLKLSDGDGLKSFKVKTRTKAEIESEVVNLTLLRKDRMPQECASFIPQITRSRFIQFELTANDSEQLFYRVYGDTNNDFSFMSLRTTTGLISNSPKDLE